MLLSGISRPGAAGCHWQATSIFQSPEFAAAVNRFAGICILSTNARKRVLEGQDISLRVVRLARIVVVNDAENHTRDGRRLELLPEHAGNNTRRVPERSATESAQDNCIVS